MRLARGLGFALWLMVTLLAVAAFAAYAPAPPEEVPAPIEGTLSAGADWGSASGRVVALTLGSALRTGPGLIDQEAEDALVAESRPNARLPTELAPPAPSTADEPPPAGAVLPEPNQSPTSMSEAEMRGVLAIFFAPEDIELALQVAFCESRWSPTATNPTSGAAGLFQQIPRFWADRSASAGWTGADIYDPHANVAVSAWLVYEGGGWVHWAASEACWGS